MVDGGPNIDEELVSVIVPTYNRAHLLSSSIGTVLAQTHANLEVIVVDDCSSDDTEGVINSLNDPRINYIKLGCNSGPSVARNEGIRRSKGEFIAFQDSDDLWRPQKLEKQLSCIHAYDAGLATCQYIVTMGNNIRAHIPSIRGDGIEDWLLTKNTIPVDSVLVKRSHLLDVGCFSETMPALEDWDLLLRLSDVCRFSSVEEELLEVVRLPGSVSGNKPALRKALEMMLDRYAHRYQKNPRASARIHFDIASMNLIDGDAHHARPHLTEAAKLDPRRLRHLMLIIVGLLGDRCMVRLFQTAVGLKHRDDPHHTI